MFSALKRLFSKDESKSSAKSRLHFVLVQDRAGLTNEDMADFKRELMDVINRYFIVQEKEVDVEYKRENDSTILLINSPVVVKRPEPLKAAPTKTATEVETINTMPKPMTARSINNLKRRKKKKVQPSSTIQKLDTSVND